MSDHVLTVSVNDLFTGRAAQALESISSRPSLYIIRDGLTVFYVGKTRQVITDRLLEHLGAGPRGADPSQIGGFILANLPESGSWLIDLLAGDGGDNISLDEKELIAELQPYYNEVYNQGGRSIPDLIERYTVPGYTQEEIARRTPPALYSFDLAKLRAVAIPGRLGLG